MSFSGLAAVVQKVSCSCHLREVAPSVSKPLPFLRASACLCVPLRPLRPPRFVTPLLQLNLTRIYLRPPISAREDQGVMALSTEHKPPHSGSAR